MSLEDVNPYEVCRYIRHYREKNGYAPGRRECICSEAYLDQLIENGVVKVLPLYEGGPPVGVVLTEKGAQMAERRR